MSLGKKVYPTYLRATGLGYAWYSGRFRAKQGDESLRVAKRRLLVFFIIMKSLPSDSKRTESKLTSQANKSAMPGITTGG